MLQAILSHRGVRWIGLGWSAFILENVVVSHNRDYLISNFGKKTYHGVYNVLSTAACGSILWGYCKYGYGVGPRLWHGRAGVAITLSSFAFQGLGLIGFSQLLPKVQFPFGLQSYIANNKSALGDSIPQNTLPSNGMLSVSDISSGVLLSSDTSAVATGSSTKAKEVWVARCPFDFSSKKPNNNDIYGLERVTRHPALWSFASLGLGTAIASPFVPTIVLFSFPTVFAFIGGEHQDHRYRNRSGGILTPEVDAVTSNIPFLALFSGKQSWNSLRHEMKWSNVSLAIFFAGILNIRRNRTLFFVSLPLALGAARLNLLN